MNLSSFALLLIALILPSSNGFLQCSSSRCLKQYGSKSSKSFAPANIHLRSIGSKSKWPSALLAKAENDNVDVVSKSILSPFVSSIPNALTVGRVLTIPVIMTSMAAQRNTLALALFVLSSFTDLLDGYLARKLNIQSSFGAFLDPVADKLLMAATLALLTVKFPSMWYAVPVATILCREIAVSALREWMAERNVRSSVKVSQIGKWKTAFQMIATALLLLVEVDGLDVYQPIGLGLVMRTPIILMSGLACLYLSTALTVFSGFKYFQAAWPLLMQR